MASWHASSGSSGGSGSSTGGMGAAQPPLATTRAQVEAGWTSRLPAGAKGSMNARTRGVVVGFDDHVEGVLALNDGLALDRDAVAAGLGDGSGG